MQQSPTHDICKRVRKVRLEVAGHRGKSRFATQLGLSSSTYDYYEASRVPPADVLVRIADVAGIDLRWLLTGEESTTPADALAHPAVRRAAALIADHPRAADALAAFLDILAESLSFPAKATLAAATAQPPAGPAAPPQAPAAPADTPAPSTPVPPPAAWGSPPAPAASGSEEWIPVLGRSAAGVPQFWADPREELRTTTLTQLIARHARTAPRTISPAHATAETAEVSDCQVVTLRFPDQRDLTEFVVAPALRERYPDAFALRIDGDSMNPEIRHGDLVILSPSAPADDARPAVVQLRHQIGVTCKLYRRQDQRVHLVPINEAVQPVTVHAGDVVWALRVLARVRSGPVT